MVDYNVLDFGAVGDGRTNDSAAIQRAIDACSDAGGGRVLLPGGKIYKSGALVIRSNIDFHVESGACLMGSSNLEDYLVPGVDVKAAGNDQPKKRTRYALIYAKDEQNITISGHGAIDGNFAVFTGEATPYHIAGWAAPRPVLLYLENCRHLTITEVTLRNAPSWTLHPVGCDDVLISGIRILNSLRMANSDGIDPDHCRNVRINNCHIKAADDCIVLKNSRRFAEYGPTENVVITGCTLISTSAAIKIGTESVSDFRNIVVNSCVISKSNRGLCIQVRDEGTVENVSFSNIVIETRRFHECWWGKAEPIYVTSLNRNAATESGKVRNISFYNISCSSENGIYLSGREGNALEEIVLENVRIEIVKWTKWQGGVYDRRPCEGEGIEYRDNAGIYCAHAEDLTLRHVKVIWGKDMPEYYGSALEIEHVEKLHLEDFQGKGAHAHKKDIKRG